MGILNENGNIVGSLENTPVKGLSSSTQQFYGDRFIPSRLSHLSQLLQFENEEKLMQSFVSEKKNKKNLSYQDSADSSPQNVSSKGSPNEEKQKQIYKNLLAQQCLGHEIFTMTPNYESLTNPLINSSITNQSTVPQSMRASIDPVNDENSCFFDQHSGIQSNGIVNTFKSMSRESSCLNNSPSQYQI